MKKCITIVVIIVVTNVSNHDVEGLWNQLVCILKNNKKVKFSLQKSAFYEILLEGPDEE